MPLGSVPHGVIQPADPSVVMVLFPEMAGAQKRSGGAEETQTIRLLTLHPRRTDKDRMSLHLGSWWPMLRVSPAYLPGDGQSPAIPV